MNKPDSEFEVAVKELWADESAVYDALLHAIGQDRIVKLVADSKAYDSVEAKAKFWDTFLDEVVMDIIRKAEEESELWINK